MQPVAYGNLQVGYVLRVIFQQYRLNGTARRDSIANCLPEGLPFPSSTREACQRTIQSLRMEINVLEKKLQDASKVASLLLHAKLLAS